MAHQFKVGDRVQWSAYAIAEGMGGKKGYGPFVVLAVDSIPSARLQGVPSAGDPNGWFHFNWLEPAPALIDPAKTYTTRDGRAVRIYATDGFEDWQAVHGAVERDGKWDVEMWFADGTQPGDPSLNLIEVKPERTLWINVYPWGTFTHNSREIADFTAAGTSNRNRIACVSVTFREGDGL